MALRVSGRIPDRSLCSCLHLAFAVDFIGRPRQGWARRRGAAHAYAPQVVHQTMGPLTTRQCCFACPGSAYPRILAVLVQRSVACPLHSCGASFAHFADDVRHTWHHHPPAALVRSCPVAVLARTSVGCSAFAFFLSLAAAIARALEASVSR